MISYADNWKNCSTYCNNQHMLTNQPTKRWFHTYLNITYIHNNIEYNWNKEYINHIINEWIDKIHIYKPSIHIIIGNEEDISFINEKDTIDFYYGLQIYGYITDLYDDKYIIKILKSLFTHLKKQLGVSNKITYTYNGYDETTEYSI